MGEIWKDVKDFEGKYQVSNLGRIKSLPRLIEKSTGNFISKEKILKGKLVNNSRLYVNLYSDKRNIQEQISVLVAIHFLGHVPSGFKLVVDHINNNPLDNREVNLQIITTRENNTKDKKGGTSKYVGVSWDKSRGKWMSVIGVDGKNIHLGRFENEEEASEAYQTKLSSLN